MTGAFSFLWNATRGYRLTPWRSPYLRWRLETYTGAHADSISAKDMVRFVWTERRQFLHFLKWTGEIAREGSRR